MKNCGKVGRDVPGAPVWVRAAGPEAPPYLETLLHNPSGSSGGEGPALPLDQ